MATRGAIGKQGQRRSCTPSGNADVAACGAWKAEKAGAVVLGGGQGRWHLVAVARSGGGKAEAAEGAVRAGSGSSSGGIVGCRHAGGSAMWLPGAARLLDRAILWSKLGCSKLSLIYVSRV
jgi:hypothetical protein